MLLSQEEKARKRKIKEIFLIFRETTFTDFLNVVENNSHVSSC